MSACARLACAARADIGMTSLPSLYVAIFLPTCPCLNAEMNFRMGQGPSDTSVQGAATALAELAMAQPALHGQHPASQKVSVCFVELE
jgi:hypothetical protein